MERIEELLAELGGDHAPPAMREWEKEPE